LILVPGASTPSVPAREVVIDEVHVVINEVYYDHPGADAGYEFVEVYNPGESAAPLDGVTLEFHNGSGAGWSVLWTGGARDSVPPRGVFTIGAEAVEPPPDALVPLSLQNGPDAVALFRAGAAVDVVGYGGLDDPDYVEDTGADGVAAGRSIARIPDGIDTDDNRTDFKAAEPTPGRTNVARHDAALVPAEGTRVHDVLEGGVVDLAIAVVNAGTEPIAAGAVTLSARDSTARGVTALGEWTNPTAIDTGSSQSFSIPAALAEGYHWLAFEARYPADERAHNDALSLLRRVGFPPVLVSEVLSYPPPGCPQFVEVYNAGAAPVVIDGWGLGDRSHDPVTVTPGPASVDPGAFVVFTPEAAALAAHFRVAGERVFEVDEKWPTFNRTGGEIADSVVLVDGLGLVVDAVSIPAVPSAAAGRSLERVDLYRSAERATWVLSTDPAGATPGRAGDRALLSPPPAGSVVVRPNPFFPSEGVMTVAIDAEDAERAVASVFDARGRRVADVGVATAFPAVLVWNGRDESGRVVLPGLYVLACRIDGRAGSRVVKEVIGCGRR